MRKISAWLLVAVLVCCGLMVSGRGDWKRKAGKPPAPLYRDPVFDGAADPSLIWNDQERAWWILYTNRRANAPDAQDGVRWCHGTDIGIASSADGGLTWTYRGTAQGLEFEPGRNTFWAPCLVEHGRTFHMFLAYVRGVPADWSGERHIVHYKSRDLVHWKFEAVVPLSSDRVIDAFIMAKRDGGWRMWFKDEAHGSHIYAANSEDLSRWRVAGPVVTGAAQEGTAVFWWKGSYWMLVDRWKGMAVLRSDDLSRWTEQPAPILDVPGTRPDDADIGRHGEVVVQGGEAYIFYFTHPFGPKDHTEPGKHRSSLQVARLELDRGVLVCDRNKPFELGLGPPSGFRPAAPPASPVSMESSDAKLTAAFVWAKAQALDYVFPASAHDDPVGDWYEAALPSRFAFCMRDVSHQATGAQVLGLGAFNLNMLGKFARGISPARDFCSYWEIDKWDRPAPVDYKNDRNFWYNLPANFDVLDACWRQFLWTGNRAYIENPEFLRFYGATAEDYVRAWDKDGDGTPEHRTEYGSRGLGGYDEGPFSDKTLYGADLIAAEARAFDSYAAILELRGNARAAVGLHAKAAGLRERYAAGWWNESRGLYADFVFVDGRLGFEDQFWSGVFPLYFGLLPAGAHREAVIRKILARKPEGIEVESYLPEIFYRYGEDKAAYAEILALSDPAKKRREYPEVPFALVGAVATGLMGIEPDARTRTVSTRSRLTADTGWAELRDVPVFDGIVNVRHEGRRKTAFAVLSGEKIEWRAVFDGLWDELCVDGVSRKALQGRDEAGRPVSWVTVTLAAGERAVVATSSQPETPKLLRDPLRLFAEGK